MKPLFSHYENSFGIELVRSICLATENWDRRVNTNQIEASAFHFELRYHRQNSL